MVKPLVSEMRSAFKLAEEYLATCVSQRAVPDEARAALLTGIPDIDSRLLDDVVDTLRERGEFGESEHQAFMIGQTAVRAARAQVASAERQTRDRRLDEAHSRVDQHQASAKAIEARLASLKAAQSQAARPEGLGRILAALAYLTVVCVVGPLALMAWGKTSLPAWARVLFVALFCIARNVVSGSVRLEARETPCDRGHTGDHDDVDARVRRGRAHEAAVRGSQAAVRGRAAARSRGRARARDRGTRPRGSGACVPRSGG